jgi:hypothetical protein
MFIKTFDVEASFNRILRSVSEGAGDITTFIFGFGLGAFELWKETTCQEARSRMFLMAQIWFTLSRLHLQESPIYRPWMLLGISAKQSTRPWLPMHCFERWIFNGGTLPVITTAFVGYPPQAPLGVQFHHSTIAVYKVFERIQSGAGRPDIAVLPAGTDIVQLNVVYSNCSLSILLSKS